MPPPEDDPVPIPKSPYLKIHEQRQLIARFIDDFCPKLDPTLNECERLHHYWVYVLPQIHGTVDLLDRAILTLSAAFLGRMLGDTCLQKRSMVMYGHAISDLSKVMSVASFCPNDAVLAAIMCLGMSEIYSPPSRAAADHGWVSHNKGGGELLKTRGASILQSKLGKGLFLRFRVTGLWTQLVFEASILLNIQTSIQAGERRPFPFAGPSLRRISRIASENSHYDMLIDEMVDIPGLLHDVNVLSGRRGNAMLLGDIAQDIFLRAVTIAENLRNWLSCFTSKYPIPYTWTALALEAVPSCLANSVAFPLRFQFPNLLAAQSLVHYWAAMVILMRCIMVCQSMSAGATHPAQRLVYDYRKLVYSPHLNGDIAVSQPSAVASHFADNICHSAAYSSYHDKGMAGPIMLLFPLWIAKDTYANDESGLSHRKESYCVEVLKELAGRGMQISDVLINLSTKDVVQTC